VSRSLKAENEAMATEVQTVKAGIREADERVAGYGTLAAGEWQSHIPSRRRVHRELQHNA
jgi:hypothetical protein